MLEVFGIGVGSITVQLEHYAYHPGETIRGEVAVRLRSPEATGGVVVGVRARQRIVDRSRSPRDYVVSARTETVWEFRRELAGPGTLATASYAFELGLPADLYARQAEPPPGLVGDVVRAIAFLQREKRYPLQWQVYGRLLRPWKVDLTRRVDIVVTEASPPER
jgi:hypothetical protein